MFERIILLALLVKGGEMIDLPSPQFTNVSLEECIKKRRSIRDFENKELTLQQISNLLWSAQGITDSVRELRAVPSAGATYPLELFIAKKDGLFRYIPNGHKLKKEQEADLRKDIARAALNQMFIADAGLVIIITAVYRRTAWRYGERAYRYINNEVGHCAQNIHLEAVALGLGSVPVGAFDDERIKKILKLKEEEPLYIIPVGYRKK
ncbi:MAG: SagB/ThcOx family dehydrogenase [candidate division WOR-3 bacterium]|nr:SagB/ThcOx family dehydrogenase [candidate division WOR-3 bacterium]